MGSARASSICPASREDRGVVQNRLTSLGIAYLGFVISPYHTATVSQNGSSSQIAATHYCCLPEWLCVGGRSLPRPTQL